MASEPTSGKPVTPPVLELRGVRAAYGRIEVLRGVDLAVPAGTIVGLLGANGAGKSTTLAVVGGNLRPTAGTVSMAGRDVTGADPDALARAGVCTVPEGRGVFPNLTVAENILMYTHAGVSPRDAEDIAYGHFPQLASRRRLPAGRLSGGEQQMLALGRALATRPALLLIDELSMGLAPIVVEQLYAQVAEITSSGVAVLLVEQFAGHVLGVADQVAVMVQGTIRAAGRPNEMADQLTGAYLGG